MEELEEGDDLTPEEFYAAQKKHLTAEEFYAARKKHLTADLFPPED